MNQKLSVHGAIAVAGSVARYWMHGLGWPLLDARLLAARMR
ncbi:hypothetical protein PV375_08845 [Gulosibacter sp. GYB002]